MNIHEKEKIKNIMTEGILEEIRKEIERKRLFNEENKEKEYPVLNILCRFLYTSNGGNMRFLHIDEKYIDKDNNDPHLRVVEHKNKIGLHSGSYYVFWNTGRYSMLSIETRTPDYWRQAFEKFIFAEYLNLNKIPVVYDDRGLFYIFVENDYVKEFIDKINKCKEIYFLGRKKYIHYENEFTMKINLLNI